MATIPEALAIARQCHHAGQFQAAEQIYRQILAAEPNHAETYNKLGNVLRDQGKLDEAVACYRQALDLDPDFAGAQYNLGNALRDQGNLDEAIASYRRALNLKPDFFEAHGNLGRALEEKGDFKAAEDSFRAALRHNSRFTLAHYHLAALLRGKLPQEDLAAQRRLLEEPTLPDAKRLFLHFGLAQVLDARGEYTEAVAHLDQGNAMQLSEWRKRRREYEPDKHELFVSQMIAVCGAELFKRVRGFGLDSEVPVFVVGLPRSGTTLVEQILASHSQVFGAGEITLAAETLVALGGQGADVIGGIQQLNRETAKHLASRHLMKLQALNPAALRIVDKMPDNYQFLGLLASLFPRAKFIHCRRDLRDIAVSCWITHFKEIPWANDQQHIASRFHEYQRIMEHWQKVLPVSLLEVDYEETVADLEGVARRLVGFCGLEWEPGCLEFHRLKRAVSSVSAVQVRQPVYRTSVGRWKHYEQALGALFAQLPAP